MRQAYATPEWRDEHNGDLAGWMRTGVVRPMARLQTKGDEYPRGGDPYHDEHGRLASAPGGANANALQPAAKTHGSRAPKRDVRLPTNAMSYDDLRSTIAKNNRSKLPDDLITAIACESPAWTLT